MRRRWWFVTGCAFLLLVGGTRARSQQPSELVLLPVALERPPVVCATPAILARQLRGVTLLQPADGTPLSFTQDPPILTPDHEGRVSVQNLTIIGDYRTLAFNRVDPLQPSGYTEESWPRASTRTIDGRIISVFEKSYPASQLGDILKYSRQGYDIPQAPLGSIDVPGTGMTPNPDGTPGTPETRQLLLRIGPSNLPVSIVTRINNQVQFASHLVNLVIPGFGDARVRGGELGYDLEGAAHLFYRYFQDVYHTLAFVPRRSWVSKSAAWHLNVKNDVRAIGMPLMDESALYGSGGTLRGVEMYSAGWLATQETSSHEIGHQVGDQMNLAQIARITPMGHEPTSHTPLLFEGESLLGAVLTGTRRVRRVAAPSPTALLSYQIERASGPIAFHPLQLYRLGFLTPAQVPVVQVFRNQGQFSPAEASEPPPGAPVMGGTTTVGINDIMAAHNVRSGPIFSVWRLATILVSRESLLSHEEMDFYNFHAQRLAATSGTTSYDGFPSFYESTGNRVTLRTDVDPKPMTAPKIIQPLRVQHPPFGPKDWRGAVFDTPVPSLYLTGRTVRLSGQVDPTLLPGTHSTAIVQLTRYSDDSTIQLQTSIVGGRFAFDLQFTVLQTGSYRMGLFLFLEGTRTAMSVANLTPITVATPPMTPTTPAGS